MSVRLSLVVASLLAVVSAGVAAADITIRSVPYEPPKAQAQAVQQARAARVEQVPAAALSNACPCGHSLVCVGPKGGRYCVNSRGQKKYQ